MEQWRMEGLRQLGIDFSKTSPCCRSFVFDDLPAYRGNYFTYSNGALFVNGTAVSKGVAFLSFLKKAELCPKRIIFIDDRDENLLSLEAAIETVETPGYPFS